MIRPLLEAADVKLGRDRLFEILSDKGMLVSPKLSQWPRTTHVDAHPPAFKNPVKWRARNAPNQVWASDIASIRTLQAFLYLALITDSWSRKIVKFHLGQTLETHTAHKALAMEVKELPRGQRPIHHSDRGCQYAWHEYVQSAQRAGLTMSMTQTNHRAENALAQRVNGILKEEFWLDREFEDEPEARQATVQSIWIYNERRPHGPLGLATPEPMRHAAQN